MDDVPAWMRWTWFDQMPRDEAELRRFTRLYRGLPLLQVVLGAVYLLAALVDLWAFGRTDWLRWGFGSLCVVVGLWLLQRGQIRVRLAREHVATLGQR